MPETRQTTIRFGGELYERLALASEKTGLPINSIVIVACMDWLRREMPATAYVRNPGGAMPIEESTDDGR